MPQTSHTAGCHLPEEDERDCQGRESHVLCTTTGTAPPLLLWKVAVIRVETLEFC